MLGSAAAVVGKNVVEWIGQSSLESGQMMATIIKALEKAGMTQEQNKKVSLLRLFMTKLRSKNASRPTRT